MATKKKSKKKSTNSKKTAGRKSPAKPLQKRKAAKKSVKRKAVPKKAAAKKEAPAKRINRNTDGGINKKSRNERRQTGSSASSRESSGLQSGDLQGLSRA